MRQHTPLVVVGGSSASRTLQPVPLTIGKEEGGYDEAWIRDLLFEYPEALPIEEIDAAFGPLIPICTELDTRGAGFADALYVNHLGFPTLIEAKLWRNPEARREVVGQILDYARTLCRWTYADLQREAARARKEPGFDLFSYVRERHSDVEEAAFVDAISRNLAQGRILLLILGDGIREGVEAIAEYIQGHAGMHFTFGLVEAPVYDLGDGRQIVQPRILAKTAIVNRTVVDTKNPDIVVKEAQAENVEEGERTFTEREIWMKAFWSDLISTIKLDDAEQPLPKSSHVSNVFFMLPTSGNIWISCYFSQKERAIGVFLAMNRASPAAIEVGQRLLSERDDIDCEIGLPVRWKQEPDGKLQIAISKPYWPLRDEKTRDEQLQWFQTTVNAFVNAFRPRVATAWKEINSR